MKTSLARCTSYFFSLTIILFIVKGQVGFAGFLLSLPAGLETSTIPGGAYAEFIRLGFDPPYFGNGRSVFQQALEVSCRARPQSCVEQLYKAFQGITSDEAKRKNYQVIADVIGQVLLLQESSRLTSTQKAGVLDFLTGESLTWPSPGLYESISRDPALIDHMIESFRLAGQKGTPWREENILRIVGRNLQFHPEFDPHILAYIKRETINVSRLRAIRGSVFRPGALRDRLFELAKANDTDALEVLQATAQAAEVFREQLSRARPPRGAVQINEGDRVAADPALRFEYFEKLKNVTGSFTSNYQIIEALQPSIAQDIEFRHLVFDFLKSKADDPSTAEDYRDVADSILRPFTKDEPYARQFFLERVKKWKVDDGGLGHQIAALTPAVAAHDDLQQFFLSYLSQHKGNNEFYSRSTLSFAAKALKEAIAVHENLIPAVLELIPAIANPEVQSQLVEFLYPHLRSSPEVERAFASWLRSGRMNLRFAVATGFRKYPVPLSIELAHELAAALQSSNPMIQDTAFDLMRQFHRGIQTANGQVTGYRTSAVQTNVEMRLQIHPALADAKFQTALLDHSAKNKNAGLEVMSILANVPGASPQLQKRLERLAADSFHETSYGSVKRLFRNQLARLKALTRSEQAPASAHLLPEQTVPTAAPAKTPLDARSDLHEEVDAILAQQADQENASSTGLRVHPTEEIPYVPAEDVEEWTAVDEACIANSLAARLGK